MKWFRWKIPVWPFGYHKIDISYIGHDYGDSTRNGMYLELSYNGRLYGLFHRKWRIKKGLK